MYPPRWPSEVCFIAARDLLRGDNRRCSLVSSPYALIKPELSCKSSKSGTDLCLARSIVNSAKLRQYVIEVVVVVQRFQFVSTTFSRTDRLSDVCGPLFRHTPDRHILQIDIATQKQ